MEIINKVREFLNKKTGSYSALFLLIPIVTYVIGQVSYSLLTNSTQMSNIVYLNVFMLFTTVLHFVLSGFRAYSPTVRSYNKIKLIVFPLLILLVIVFCKKWINSMLFGIIFIDIIHTSFQYKMIAEYDELSHKNKICNLITYLISLVVHILPIIFFITPELIKKALTIGVDQSSPFSFEGISTILLVENFYFIKSILYGLMGTIIGIYILYQIKYKSFKTFKNLFLLTTFIVNLLIWSKGNFDIILFVINVTHALEYLVFYSFVNKEDFRFFKNFSAQINVIIISLITIIVSLLLSLNNNLGIQIGLFIVINHYFMDLINWRKNE